MKKPLIGIIGGTGRMGQLFKKLFEKRGYKVLIASRHTEINPAELAKKSDVVIISVPISATESVIKEVAPHIKKESLLMDITSLKIEPVKAMLKHSKCEVIGTHPVFGPNTKSLKGETFIVCPARSKKWLAWLLKILKEEKANLKITTPQKHDKVMALVQGLRYFTTFIFADAIKNKGIKNSLDYSSPSYRKIIEMIKRISSEDKDLCYGIMKNPDLLNNIKIYKKSLNNLENIIRKNNEKEFKKFFNNLKKIFYYE